MDLLKSFNFIKTAKSWDQIFKTLSQINKSNELQAGKLFEIFCKHYFIVKNEFKSVKLLSEADLTILKKLNIESKDHGCDLVIITNDNKYAAVQCKFTNNQDDKTLNWTGDRLSSFLAASTKTDVRIIFTNASGVSPAVIRKASEQSYIQYDFQHLNELSESEIKSIYRSIQGAKIKKVFYKPKHHQEKAISTVVSKFKKSPRGKLILPCGAGKTLTALWIKEKLKPTKTLVLVPSLSLLRQFKKDWISQEKIKSSYFCVCSENDIANSDSPEIGIHEIGGMVTTNPTEIRGWLSNNNHQVVYATYQSSPRIAEAMKRTNLKFDLVICDEAHRTSGEKKSTFATILDDKKIKASKRLFMTATPRIVSEKIKDKLGNESYKYLADMNDEALYGKEFFYMNFGDAIKKNPAFLTDYKIIAVGVTDEEVASWLKNRRFANGTSINDIAHNYALEKVMTKYKANHAITFHSRVSAAKEFKERHTQMYKNTESFHVNGTQSSSNRAHDLNKFKKAKSAVITNARCLTEGVDVPAIDMVYFCDPRSSKIDIVQATGRALRVYSGKKLGYIVVPIFHNKNTNSEKAIEDGSYKVLVQVVRAMADQDARIEEEINSIKYGEGERNISSSKIQIDYDSKSRIELLGFEEKLKKSIFTNVVSRSVVKWRPFHLAKEFVNKLNLKNVKEWNNYRLSGNKPSDIPSTPEGAYKGAGGWTSWGDWLGTGRIAAKNKEFKNFEEARKFARSLNLSSSEQWGLYKKGMYPKLPLKPYDVPSTPEKTYRNKGWLGYSDFLGTGNVRLNWRSFDKAKKFVKKLNLKTTSDWKKYCNGELKNYPSKPADIPNAPGIVYKNNGWMGFKDFVGVEYEKEQNDFKIPFSKARQIIKDLGILTFYDYKKFVDGNDKVRGKPPKGLPKSLANTYRYDGWISYKDIFGDYKHQPKKWREFKKARDFVRKLKLKDSYDWQNYINGKIKGKPLLPSDIPKAPQGVYKKSGWVGLENWLGSEVNYISFEEAKKFIKKLKLKSQKDWQLYLKGNKKGLPKLPRNIPTKPERFYSKEWINLGDWLSTGNLSTSDREYEEFNKARDFVRSLKLKSSTEWRQYCNGKIKKLPSKPSIIPTAPEIVYLSLGWVGYGDWLGTGNIANFRKEYLAFESSKAFVHNLNIKTVKEWRHFVKSGKKPANIPVNPDRTYYNNGWKGYGDWLGTGNYGSRNREFLEFTEARYFVRKLKLKNQADWIRYSQSNKRPANIPSAPQRTYKNSGWIGMKDWLGIR